MALIVMGGLKDHELSDIRAAAAELSPVWAARLSVLAARLIWSRG